MRLGRLTAGIVGTALVLATPLAAHAAKAVKPPAAGKWTISDTFKGQYVAAGSFLVAKNQKTLSKLTVTAGPMTTNVCGSAPIKLQGKVKFHKITSDFYNGYYVGKKGNPKANPPFGPQKVKVMVGGKSHTAQLAIYVHTPTGGKTSSGQIAVQTSLGLCSLDWNERKG